MMDKRTRAHRAIESGESAASAQSGRRHAVMDRRRRIVKTAVFLSIVVGLFAGVGWGSLSSIGYGTIAYLCPLGALETLAAAKAAVPRFLVVAIVMLAVVALLGRAFCSWVCPVPSIEGFFHYKKKHPASSEHEGSSSQPATVQTGGAAHDGAGAAAGVERSAPADALTDEERALLVTACTSAGCSSGLAPVGGVRDRVRFDTRHGVLLGSLVATAAFGFPVFCLVCPVGLSIATVVAVWQLIVAHEPSWSLVVFPLIVLAETVLFRKWCTKLCPMGALMSLVGRRSLFKPQVDEGLCLRAKGVDCRRCVEACPELLDPHSPGLAECSKCGACADGCPAHAICMPVVRTKR